MGRVAEALRRAAEESQDVEGSAIRSQEGAFASAWDLKPAIAEVSVEAEPRSSERIAGATVASFREEHARGPATAPVRASESHSPEGLKITAAKPLLESQLALGWPQPFAPDLRGKLVLMRETPPAAVGEYDRLADELEQAQAARGVKTIAIASAVRGEGKTLTATNLALTLSERRHRRVLLVDAQLRQPRVHQIFQVSAGSGLGGHLRSSGEGIPPLVELTRYLSLLPAGRGDTDPQGLLGSERMRQLLSQTSVTFDWIVVDTPAIEAAPDACELMPLVDAALLVVEARRTPRSVVQNAFDTLGRGRILGVALNRTQPRK